MLTPPMDFGISSAGHYGETLISKPTFMEWSFYGLFTNAPVSHP